MSDFSWVVGVLFLVASCSVGMGYQKNTIDTKDLAIERLCGLATGVPEFEYIGSTLYCRTKAGNLIKPVGARFQFNTIVEKGVETTNYTPVRMCLTETNKNS